MKRFVSVTTAFVALLTVIAVAFAQDSPQDIERSYFSMWLSVGIVTIMLILFVILKLTRNPMTAGPAMVPDGVTDKTAILQFKINSVWPVVITPDDNIEVQDAEKGIISGLVSVTYGDSHSSMLFIRNETGYRAMVRRNTNEKWSQDYMLQNGARCIPIFAFRFAPMETVKETTQNEEEKYFVFRPAIGSLQNLAQFRGFKTFEYKEVRGQLSVRFK